MCEVEDPRVRASLPRVGAMSDEQLWELVQGEQRTWAETAEGIIAVGVAALAERLPIG